MSIVKNFFTPEIEIRRLYKPLINAIELAIGVVYRHYVAIDFELTERYAYITYRCIEPLTGAYKNLLVKIDRKTQLPEIFKDFKP